MLTHTSPTGFPAPIPLDTTPPTASVKNDSQNNTTPTLLHRTVEPLKELYSELKQAIHWKQRSAAFKAICLQTFTFAERALEAKLAANPSGKVNLVLDIDDCLVECSSYFAGMMDSDEQMTSERNDEWWQFGQKEKSKPLPGAMKFLKKYKDDPRVNITYLTSRGKPDGIKDWTIEMLKELGFPHADTDHVRVANSDTGKKPAHIETIKKETGTDTCLLMGDKLSDFGEVPPKDNKERREWVQDSARREKWGREYIVMPNPVYGMWEKLTHEQSFDVPSKKMERDLALRCDRTFDTATAKSDDVKARETLQGLHYVQSPAFDAYMIQLSNIAADMAEARQRPANGEAIVFDIDGTVLSNCQWRAKLCLDDKTGTQEVFNTWAKKGEAVEIAGMKNLVDKLRKQGYAIYWVTNRPGKVMTTDTEDTLRAATAAELATKGLMKEDDTLVMREDHNPPEALGKTAPRDKASRYRAIRDGKYTNGKTVPVAMHFGDAMKDLDKDPCKLHEGDEAGWDKGITEEMGRTLFLCPNPLFTNGWLTHFKEWAENNKIPLETINEKSLADRTIDHWHLADSRIGRHQEAA